MTRDDKNINDTSYTTRIDDIAEDLELARKKELERQDISDKPFEPLVPWVVEFRVIGTPEIIRAPLSERLTIGRDDAKRDIYPEIELSPYNAQVLGVSRKHARIIMRDNRITVEDLNSANGTYVNGKHIGILNPTRLRDGDQLKLGNLSLQVHFVFQPFSHDDTMIGFGNKLDIPGLAKGQRLLILDDNKEVGTVLRIIALKAGFKVLIAHTTAQAISHWDNEDIDAIIVELMLEEGNGLDLLDYVRQNADKHIPIIATTSNPGGYRDNQARAKGVDDILEKPLNVDSIIKTLDKFVGMSSK